MFLVLVIVLLLVLVLEMVDYEHDSFGRNFRPGAGNPYGAEAGELGRKVVRRQGFD